MYVLGVCVCVPNVHQDLKVKLHVICASCDLPARALVQNFIQFNGAYGCSFCEQPGKSYHTDRGGTVHVFPYNLTSPNGPRRTNRSCIEHAKIASLDHKIVSYIYCTTCIHIQSFAFYL